jgi:hypothetical protein
MWDQARSAIWSKDVDDCRIQTLECIFVFIRIWIELGFVKEGNAIIFWSRHKLVGFGGGAMTVTGKELV